MLMSGIWLGLIVLSVVFAAAGGELGSLSTAMLGGAQAAVELCISVAGALCLWSAIMEVMRRSGLSDSLSRLLRPLLRRIYPRSFSDPECAGAISSNFTANLLGLGNAATARKEHQQRQHQGKYLLHKILRWFCSILSGQNPQGTFSHYFSISIPLNSFHVKKTQALFTILSSFFVILYNFSIHILDILPALKA